MLYLLSCTISCYFATKEKQNKLKNFLKLFAQLHKNGLLIITENLIWVLQQMPHMSNKCYTYRVNVISSFKMIYLFPYLLIKKKERKRESQRPKERETFHWLGHFSNSHNGKDSVKLKCGAQDSNWVSQMWRKCPGTLIVLMIFLGKFVRKAGFENL